MNANVIIMSCKTYRKLVNQIIELYLDQVFTVPMCQHHRIQMVESLFTYLLTPEVKPLLNHPRFANFRAELLLKIDQLLADSRKIAIEWPTRRRFTHALLNVWNYLSVPTHVPVRCSGRLVARSVRRLDAVLQSCEPAAYNRLKCAQKEIIRLFKRANSLSASASVPAPVSVPVRPRIIKVKVLPRRSARLMGRAIKV